MSLLVLKNNNILIIFKVKGDFRIFFRWCSNLLFYGHNWTTVILLKISTTCAICAQIITSHKIALLMSCDIYMAFSCMGSILKGDGVSHDATVGEMPLPLKASPVLFGVWDIGSQCGPQYPLKRQLIKAWSQTTLPGLTHHTIVCPCRHHSPPQLCSHWGLWESRAPGLHHHWGP